MWFLMKLLKQPRPIEGRGDPRGDPQAGDHACDNLGEVGLALQGGEEIATAVCGPADGERRTCRYYRQMDRAAAVPKAGNLGPGKGRW
jgi:hypothetical protein